MKYLLLSFILLLLIPPVAFAVDIAPRAMEDQPLTETANELEQIGQKNHASLPVGTMFGRIRSTIIQISHSEGDTNYNYLDTTTDARLGYTVKSKIHGWVTSGTIDFNMKSADSSVKGRYLYVTLEDQNFSYRLGRQEPGGSTLGGKHIQDIGKKLSIGETIRDGDYFTFRVKSIGLKLVLGRYAIDKDVAQDLIASDKKAQALFWEGSGGNHKFTMSYTLINERANSKELALSEDVVFTDEDYKALAFGWQYAFGDAKISINFDNWKQEYLDAPLRDNTKNKRILFYDYRLNQNSGLTLGYNVEIQADSSRNPTIYSSTNLGYTYYLGIIRIYAAYNQVKTIDADEDSIKTNQFGIGLGAFFK